MTVLRHHRDARELAVFSYWLDKRMIRKGITAMAFMRLCDAGKVPGFAPDDWPDSGTVSGLFSDAENGEQRGERGTITNPGSAAVRPGPVEHGPSGFEAMSAPR